MTYSTEFSSGPTPIDAQFNYRPSRRNRRFASPPAYLRSLLDRLVATSFGIDTVLLIQPSRGRAHVARARQVAMYLAHTECGLSLTEVGKLYERDRTTVAHACQIVEDGREDRHFDAAMQNMACAIAIMQAAYSGLDLDVAPMRPL